MPLSGPPLPVRGLPEEAMLMVQAEGTSIAATARHDHIWNSQNQAYLKLKQTRPVSQSRGSGQKLEVLMRTQGMLDLHRFTSIDQY